MRSRGPEGRGSVKQAVEIDSYAKWGIPPGLYSWGGLSIKGGWIGELKNSLTPFSVVCQTLLAGLCWMPGTLSERPKSSEESSTLSMWDVQSKTKQPGQTQFYSQIGGYSDTYSSTILLWKIKRMKYAIVDYFYSIISKVELFLFTLGLFPASWREGLPVKIKTTQRNGTLTIYKVYLTKVLKFINI